jgi:microcystin-dependent protein
VTDEESRVDITGYPHLLLCDGALLNSEDEPELYAVIGNLYG